MRPACACDVIVSVNTARKINVLSFMNYVLMKKFYAIITNMYIFIAGTARSGKSEYAEARALALGASARVYLATAQVIDSEMRRRVALHQARREGMGFVTVERTHDLGALVLPEGVCVLIESLTTWLANEMFSEGGVNHDAGSKVYRDFVRLRGQARHVVLVSDDVFCDGVSYDPLTEGYLRTLGGLHVKLAALADEVVEVVSGIPLRYSIITEL